jgi:hypothetical protein
MNRGGRVVDRSEGSGCWLDIVDRDIGANRVDAVVLTSQRLSAYQGIRVGEDAA